MNFIVEEMSMEKVIDYKNVYKVVNYEDKHISNGDVDYLKVLQENSMSDLKDDEEVDVIINFMIVGYKNILGINSEESN